MSYFSISNIYQNLIEWWESSDKNSVNKYDKAWWQINCSEDY